jgi:predicted dehydrogenase
MRTVGIMGLGSIGRRHARVLKLLDAEMEIHACRTRHGALAEPYEHVVDRDRAEFFSSKFDLIVIANPSSLHLSTLEDVLRAELAKTVVVEKPFCLPEEIAAAQQLIAAFPGTRVLPGNTLRFHPAIERLKAALRDHELGKVLECHAHFGTYMPGWHPWEDYRSTYAARRELGGGVLLTSIHEIDLVHHLFGNGTVAGAHVARLALDEIDVEDSAHVLLIMERCGVANVSLNFFERPADRFLKVIFERGVWSWKFGQPVVTLVRPGANGFDETQQNIDPAVDAMYLNMWRCVLQNDLRAFEMDSVFSSLKTAHTAKVASEAPGWN